MTKPMKILRNVAIGLMALLTLLMIAAIVVVQTDWFREFVRQKIITATEEGTGGRAEIGSFSFDWRHLRAVFTDFTIHGKEPAGAAPFARVRRVELDLRLFTSLKRPFELSYLGLDRPEVNISVAADGQTNIPTPKQQSTSNTTTLETVVDLAVNHFELTNGLAVFNSQPQALNVRANNLRAQLWYNLLARGYRGQLSLQPMYVAAGKNTPVVFTITLPVELQRDRVTLENARIATARSEIFIDGSLDHLLDPKTSAHIKGHVALRELQSLGNLPLALNAGGAPQTLELDATATVANNIVRIAGLRLGLGASDLEASGTLKDPNGQGALQFKSRLALGELGRLAKVAQRPEGKALLNGTVKLDAANNYQVAGNVSVENLSIQQGAQRIRNVNLSSAVRLDPHHLNLEGLRLSAFGGELAGDVSLEDFARFKVNGVLRHLDLKAAAAALGQKDFAYDGIASGPVEAAGDLSAPGTRGISAKTRLAIAPGRRGIPVSGRLNASFNGASDSVSLADSYIALPHTRLTLSGSLGQRIDVNLTTQDLNDLLAAAAMKGPPPVTLTGGEADFHGTITGRLSSPRIEGHLAVNRFSVEGRRFDALAADVSAASSGAAVSNGSLSRNTMRTEFSARVGLANWKPTPHQPLTADASIQNGDLADILAMAGQPSGGYSGSLSATAHVAGSIGNPVGSANLAVANGTIDQEPFDRIQAQVNMSDQLLAIPSAYLTAGAARVDLSAELHHARDSLTKGQLHAHVRSNAIDLARLQTVARQWPNSGGSLQIQADATGNLTDAPGSAFVLTSVNADASVRSLRYQAQNYGDATATARTSGQTVSYNVVSDFAGSNIRVNGNTQLARGYPTTATASIGNLPIERVLAVAGQSSVPAKGSLSGTAKVSGTLENPEGAVDLDLARAVLYGEPIDHVRARVEYLAGSVDVRQLDVSAGPSRIGLTARLDHPVGNLKNGSLRFHLDSSNLDLARIRTLQKTNPGLSGAIRLAADGAATLSGSEPQISLRDLNLNLSAAGIAVQRKPFGDLTLTANTSGGQVNFALNSNLAGASIQGSGSAQLAADYPVNANLTFRNVTWTRIHDLAGSAGGAAPTFEAAADGQLTVNGPVRKVAALRGSFELSRLRLSTVSTGPNSSAPVVIQNEGPLTIALDRGVARITNLHLTGPQTDIQGSGTFGVESRALDLTVKANTDLGLIEDFDEDVTSSGAVALAATVRGTTANPIVNGQLELRNATVNYATIPNGIANANGVVVFTGNSASIRNLTAQSGGGTVTIGGFVSFRDLLRFGVRVNAAKVRVRVQQGVSIVADANVNLTGTAQSSVVSGAVTITQVTYAPQSDFGSILSRAAPPVQAPAAPSPLLDNMKLDVRVRTSASMAVQASLAQNLQSDADIQIRGTASQPAVLGRVTINEGQLVFFGSTYTVNSGTISFYNPVRIEPVLNISLETRAKGVDVVLTVTGPIDNMKLSYTSDPPLQFQEIVSLLASGKTPTSDPTILANQPSTPPQSFEQMGESALVSKALADPVSSRLQRVFGVSQLKIDPAFTSGSELPQARLTLQQQISTNVTFTYVTDLNDPNTQIIRAEWAFNSQWSAIATRDQNGIFSVNFFYKKQFR